MICMQKKQQKYIQKHEFLVTTLFIYDSFTNNLVPNMHLVNKCSRWKNQHENGLLIVQEKKKYQQLG